MCCLLPRVRNTNAVSVQFRQHDDVPDLLHAAARLPRPHLRGLHRGAVSVGRHPGPRHAPVRVHQQVTPTHSPLVVTLWTPCNSHCVLPTCVQADGCPGGHAAGLPHLQLGRRPHPLDPGLGTGLGRRHIRLRLRLGPGQKISQTTDTCSALYNNIQIILTSTHCRP